MKPLTIQQALSQAAVALQAAGIDNAALDARVLLCHALGIGMEDLIKNKEKQIDKAAVQRYQALVARRQQHEPIAQITGKKEFWSLDFTVTPATLTPRPETETLIETALQWFPDREVKYEILDLGTGTGCLLITLLRELPQSIGIGIDISTKALAVAQANADALRVSTRARFLQGSWAEGISGRFDIIVSNPPYIPVGEIPKLARDVAEFDPPLALSGGEDGLDAYRMLLPAVGNLLKEKGIALFEIGQGQAEEVEKIAREAQLEVIAIKPDLAGIDRCIIVKRRVA